MKRKTKPIGKKARNQKNGDRGIKELRNRLEAAEAELKAIRSGEVDAILTSGPHGDQVFTLKTAEHPYRVLVESMNEGAATLNARGEILYCNNKLADILECPVEKLIGVPLSRFVNPVNRELFETIIEKGVNETSRAEITIVTELNKPRYVLLSARNITIDTIKGVCMVIADLTKEKKDREYLASVEKQLAEARRLSDIGMLAATVAHELRNPLAAIGTAAFNIKRKAGIIVERPLTTIEKKIRDSDQIINNLLFYSRLKAPQRQKLNIYIILKECISNSRERYPRGNVSIIERLQEIKDAEIKADPLQMRELFINILNNAFDAVSPTEGRIELCGTISGDSVVITISDNGSGIEDADLGRLFQPFFTAKSKGTGLGLSVSKQIVQLHEGDISIASQKDKGTKVTIRLPIEE